ncbi:polyribonucleotide nucleotidyltransferase [candidate division WOR-3 bacterium]|nr:polyribonucleotide nucleotidyltransferase [candidate division WOR-3 bacterium]
MHRVEREVCGRTLSFEFGRVARQADAGLLVRYGDTIVFASACYKKEPVDFMAFFPLTVDYREMAFASGKIPGGFFKREGAPRDKEKLTCRLVDRPIRPLFPENFRNETQIISYLFSSDSENESDLLALLGASCALAVSEIPFLGPIGACRIGKVNGELVANPLMSQLDDAEMSMMFAGIRNEKGEDLIMMIAGEAKGISHDDLDRAVEMAMPHIRTTLDMQLEMVKAAGKPKIKPDKPNIPPELEAAVRERAESRVRELNKIQDKLERQEALDRLKLEVVEALAEQFPDSKGPVAEALDALVGRDVRRMAIEDNRRLDGRAFDAVRPITCEVGVLPRAHGSALFTRGQTQSICAATLGTKSDRQVVDDVELEVEEKKRFMLHYNFPPFSVGEVRFLRGPSRRDVGHGDLAEKALEAVAPTEEEFPYTIRLVSYILESNGSSSMASACAGSLAMMDAGIPVKSAVAGMAMGLIKEGDKYHILTDILGAEDHYGDMDFKVTGTRDAITAIQLDLKLPGVPWALLREAVLKATEARRHVLDVMEKTIAEPRPDISRYAPRIVSIVIDKEKIGTVIGPGGKMIRRITEETGSQIDIEDDGTVTIASNKPEALAAAKAWVESLVAEAEIGKVYHGTVTRIMTFGAFVEILPGKEGLVHISQLAGERVREVEDVVKVGDKVWVKVVEVDDLGRVNLSRKKALEERGELPPSEDDGIAKRPPRPRDGGRDRGSRDHGRDRGPRGRDRGPRR